MQALGIVGSIAGKGTRKHWCGEALKGAAEDGARPELLLLRDLEIRPCDGCYSCSRKGVCHIRDDMQTGKLPCFPK